MVVDGDLEVTVRDLSLDESVTRHLSYITQRSSLRVLSWSSEVCDILSALA